MRKLFTIVVAVLLTANVFLPQQAGAQTPEKMSYQAIIRDASENLITNQTIGMQISILQGSMSGAPVFVETHTPTTNTNGLVSVEIGTGFPEVGSFSLIDWSAGAYFLKTETDTAGGTNYTIIDINRLISVPYALHAKTAETITGTISETDPVFGASIASGITEVDTTNWNNKIENEIDPVYSSSVAGGITGADTTNWNNKIENEIDPVYSSSVASSITASDTTNWNNKQDQLTAGTGINIENNVISTKNDFYLGQDTLNGIVFYIYLDQNGVQHGLIVSKNEAWAQWQNTEVDNDANRSWDGAYNMALMTDSPAKEWITNNFSSQWYLPSIDELSLLWHNRFHVNKALNDAGLTLLGISSYWSSTEGGATAAYVFNFSYGNANCFTKTSNGKVRAVRAF